MGLFEENPILLVPIVLTIVIGYDLVKYTTRRILERAKMAQPDGRAR
jgi:hypothetical protein